MMKTAWIVILSINTVRKSYYTERLNFHIYRRSEINSWNIAKYDLRKLILRAGIFNFDEIKSKRQETSDSIREYTVLQAKKMSQ